MLRKVLKYLGIGLALIFIIIQFINRPDKLHIPANENDMIAALEVAPEMANLLKTACYDCHSNQPVYPWYANIAPVSWWIDEHMEHGRDELNFSNWATFSKRRRDHKLEEIIEEVEEGHMPLPSYLWMHSDARLSQTQIDQLKAWVEKERAKISQED